MDVRQARDNEVDLPWSWHRLLQDQLQGEDPTAGWRGLVAVGVQASFGVVVAPAMPAAFVLQWSLEVAAEAGLYAAVRLRGIHDPARSGLTFAVQPAQGYPTTVRFRSCLSPASPDHGGENGENGKNLVSANQAAYRRAAVRFAESYQPGVNLGRQQRLEMVRDVWAAAVARSEGNPPPRRGSCCYIYVLPGGHECAGCPRRVLPADRSRRLPPD